MTVAYLLTDDDIAAWRRHERRRRVGLPELANALVLTSILAVTTAAAAALASPGLRGGVSVDAWAAWTAGWIAVGFIASLVAPAQQPGVPLHAKYLRLVRRPRRTSGAGPVVLTLAEEGVEIISGDAEVTVPWRDVDEVREMPGHFFVLTSDDAVIIAPKRAFPDPDSSLAFAAAIRARATGSEWPVTK